MDVTRLVTNPLVVVTNREPYVDEKTGTGTRTIQLAGGVVSALDPLLQEIGGDWIAWGSGSADRQTAPRGIREVPPKRPRYRLHRVFLLPAEEQGYYTHYSNQGLWPLSHMLVERARFSRRAWPYYRSVNQKFARVTAAKTELKGWVFSHDYHLALFPAQLRAMRPDVSIAHFWHIPWPAFTVFRLCPQYQQILQGLLGADILAFQTPDDVEDFLHAVHRTVHAKIDFDRGTVDWEGRTVHVRAIPISVDFEDINALVRQPRVDRWVRGIRRKLVARDHILGISVDRADYTKGIIPRLHGIREFFQRYPEHRGEVTFLQVVVPTRSEVNEYRTLYHQVEEETRRINQEFRQPGWTPVVTIRRHIDRARIMGLFRAADFGLVSSLFDGMNLVAKEFVSAQIDARGVLLLSESAGASNELSDAFSINPLDPEGFASTLHAALNLPMAERMERMARMRDHIQQHTIYDWLEEILKAFSEVSSSYAPE